MKKMLVSLIIASIGLVLGGAPKAESKAVDEGKEGFISLFNGKDLTSWTVDTVGYRVEGGILVADPLGNLYTEAEYSDFILRFEFKLTPGANNGIGVRVPMGGKASREGIEIQILDDAVPKFAEAKPW